MILWRVIKDKGRGIPYRAIPAASAKIPPMKVAARKYRRGTFAAVAVMAVVYLLGNGSVGLWDRDEPRYAQTSRQMLLSQPADWVVPRLLDRVRTAKPIFIYWCQAASMRVFGINDFGARLPSAAGMAGTLLLVGLAAGRWLGWRRAFWTVVVLGTSGLSIAAGKMCITDAVLLLWVTGAQVCLCAIYLGANDRRVAAVMWAAAGLAILTKGPVVLAVSGMTILVLVLMDLATRPAAEGKHRGLDEPGRDSAIAPRAGDCAWSAWRWLARTRPLSGVFILAAICGPWLLLVHLREPTFLPRAIGHEIVNRASKALEGHKGPPGYYLATIWGTFMPWSLMLIAVLVVAWRNRGRPIIRFALAAIIGPWILMELVQTKLAHYILPVFPPLALLTADLVVRCLQGRHDDLTRRLNVLPVSLWCMAVALIGCSGFAGGVRFPEYRVALLIPSIGLAALGVTWAVVVWVLWFRKSIERAMLAMAVGMVAVLLWTYLLYLPRAGFLWLPRQIGQILRDQGATHAGDVGMIDYQEDSLYWYQGGTIAKPDDNYFRITPQAQWMHWMVMSDDFWRTQPPHVRAEYAEVARQRGLAYADRMRVLDVVVLRRRVQ